MIYTLMSLKFFAFFAIYLHHLDYNYGLGPISVTFFFIVSGFIMAYNYSGKIIRMNSRIYWEYYFRRLTRIYPMHILTLIISIPLVQITHFKTNIIYTFLNIFLLQTYFPIGIQVFAYNAVSWFIADVVFFYAITPFLLVLLYRTNIIYNRNKLIILQTCAFATGFIISYTFHDKVQAFTFGWWYIYISPYFRIFDYLIGFLSGLIFISLQNEYFIGRSKTFFSILELSAISMFFISYRSTFLGFDSLKYDMYYVPALTILVFVFAFQRGILSRLLSFKLFIRLGTISYPLFMIHQLMIAYVAQLFAFNIYDQSYNAKVIFIEIIIFIIIIFVSFAINRYFEEPTKVYLRKYLVKNEVAIY